MRLLMPCPRCERPPFDRGCPLCDGLGIVGLTPLAWALGIAVVFALALGIAAVAALAGPALR